MTPAAEALNTTQETIRNLLREGSEGAALRTYIEKT
jgi:hypothetical protein